MTKFFGFNMAKEWSYTSVECKSVESDIFDEIEFLVEYQNIGLYAHLHYFNNF